MKKRKAVKRMTVEDLNRVMERARKHAAMAASFVERLKNSFSVRVSHASMGTEYVFIDGFSARGRLVMLAAVEEEVDKAKSLVRLLDDHKIQHDIRLPNVRALRREFGGGVRRRARRKGAKA